MLLKVSQSPTKEKKGIHVPPPVHPIHRQQTVITDLHKQEDDGK